VTELQPLLAQFPTEEHPTFFEVVTVMALRYFAEQNCDLVIWETGLGGRLDATNIVTPLASVITNIQYDHQKWLGETLTSIAAEKAGIIKPGIPVITATDEPEALKVIEDTVCGQRASLTMVRPSSSLFYASAASDSPSPWEEGRGEGGRDIRRPEADSDILTTLELPLLGAHQRLNAALAIATVRVLYHQIPVSDESIRTGLSQLNWPGRLQFIKCPSGQRILLDGAHNIGGAKTLASALNQYFPDAKPTLILGILQDKDWDAICRILAPLASRLLLAPVPSERTANPDELASACREANPSILIQPCASLAVALSQSASDPFVLITGSLYLVGEAMDLLGLSASKAQNERGLNEWTAPAQVSTSAGPKH
jgi:dihydrofolate synthase/folylpolyglutamate synthase